MVPARSLPHLVRRNHAAHGATTAAAIRCDDDVVTPPREPTRYMAQEPINHHQHQHDPPKPPPPPRETDDHRIQGREPPLEQPPTQNQRLQLQLGGDGQHHHHRQQQQQEVAGTSGSSSGGSSSNGGGGNNGGARDWLRLGTGPASPGASGSDHDNFASDNRATTTTTAPAPPTLTPRHHDVLVLPGMPPGSFLRPGPAMPGIPQASIPTHMPRAAPPWLPPWSPAATAPPPLLPFAHDRAFYAAAAAPTTPASSGFDAIRVVLPPSAITAAAGVWFVLQAAPHQGREPFLPQIPRSYLRIKDGRVTVRLLTKYLVNKLGLEDESEVEITCRGRQLLPILTLQHVRDSIWCRRDAVSPSSVQAPDISTADHHHIMVLQYGRRP